MNNEVKTGAVAVAVIAVLWSVGAPVRAGDAETLEELKAKIHELDQKVKILERNRELDQEAAATKIKATPTLTVGEKGFAMSSADGAFQLKLKGILQMDSRTYLRDHGKNP